MPASSSVSNVKSVVLPLATEKLSLLEEWRVPYEEAPQLDFPWGRFGAVHRDGLYWPSTALIDRRGVSAGRYEVGGITIWVRPLADEAVKELVDRIPGVWAPAEAVRDTGGVSVSSVWRSLEGGTILPFDPDEAVLNVRSERYRELGRGRRSPAKRVALTAYYGTRPLLPRRLQIAMRRVYKHVQARSEFPRWPLETCVHDLVDMVLAAAADATGSPLPTIAPWPSGRTWALVLTHDVETAAGRDHIGTVCAVEERAGVRSSFNLVPEQYETSDALVAELLADGFEVGVHGLRHDGRDLASLATLKRRLPEMRRWAARWQAVGFRSPATHRVWEWMPLLGFDYDSSYPDSDPYEPVPGGCCTWLPFFNEDLVELPITLPQDHTIFVILGIGASAWHDKTALLKTRGGMALMITHPDYLLKAHLLTAYDDFLAERSSDSSCWIALPREVSAWWRRRAATSIHLADGGWTLRGPAAEEAEIGLVYPQEGPTRANR